MPPKARITKEMIIGTGTELVRKEGAESLNVRRIAAELGCSTQPVMYSFSTVEELKTEIYRHADSFHSEYIMNVDFENEDAMLLIGLNYIRFAYEEKNLFRFLFQSDKIGEEGVKSLLESDEFEPVYAVLQQEAELTAEQAREAFSALFAAVHGFASLLANNSLDYDEEYFTKVLTEIFYGVIGVMKEEML
ncbi:MAG: TetR/AcrR family transcriptional regulator [Oscillospiraceae bacterium]|nr:TetR/AcrR family transcriptional regulator [Oscillospiraceae bacterium]